MQSKKIPLPEQTLPQHKDKRSVLLIDGDPVYRLIMTQTAEKKGIRLITCGSLGELADSFFPFKFDVALIDQHLDGIRMDLKGSDIARTMEAVPVVLISYADDALETLDVWPINVRKFLLKDMGPEQLLDKAVGIGTTPS